MKSSPLLPIALSLALMACSSSPHTSSGSASSAKNSCTTYKLLLKKCKDTGASPKVDILTDKMEFDPENVCVEAGQSIEFTLKPVPDDKEGSAAIIPEDYKDAWLTGTNYSPKNKIKIKVPKWVDPKKTYKYKFIKYDGKCVDPRIEVTK